MGSGGFQGAVEEGDQDEEENCFVDLGGVAGDVVTEVDSPGQIGRSAVGVVGEAGEEAADASDGDAKGERNGVEVASGSAESDVALGEFDGEESEDESADDGFAADQVGGVVEIVPGELRVFEPEEELGAERASGDGCGDYGPAERSGEGIGKAAAEFEIDGGGDDVGEGFEKQMRVDGIGAEVEIDGEGDCVMGWGNDGEL